MKIFSSESRSGSARSRWHWPDARRLAGPGSPRLVRSPAAVLMAVSLCLSVAGTATASAEEVTINAIEGTQFSGQVATATCTSGTPTGAGFTITWGNGAVTTASTTISGQQILISGTNTYAEEGTYTGAINGKYSCGTMGVPFSDSLTALVADAKLSGAIELTGATTGQPLSGQIATFTDTDPGGTLTDYSATISWGDGAKSAGQILTAGAGFAIQGSHTYAKSGSYPLSLIISDAGGASVTPSGTVRVAPNAQARFTLPRAPKAGSAALFDAAGSHPSGQKVTSFLWTIRGRGVLGGVDTVNCGGDTSEMTTSFGRSGTVTTTLQVKYATGDVSSTSHSLRVLATRVRPQASWAVGHGGQATECVRGSGDPGIVPVSGVPDGCQDEVHVGLIDAIGCFTPLTDYAQLPRPEFKQLCPYFSNLSICKVSESDRVPGLGPGSGSAVPTVVPAGICGTKCQLRMPLIVPLFMSTSPARINGISIAPDHGAAIVLDVNDGAMATSGAAFSLLDGKLVFKDGPLVTSVFNVNGDLPLLDANLDQLEAGNSALASLLDLSGFQLGGTMSIDLVQNASTVNLGVTLPASFTDPFGNGGVTSTLSASVDNQNGLQLDKLHFVLPSADFGAVKVDNMTFCYQQHIHEDFCQTATGADFGNADPSSSSWNATGNVNVLGVELDASPPPGTYGIGFVNGQFDFGGAFAAFNPGLPLGDSGVFLDGLGASLAVNPARFTGAIQLEAADIIRINGTLFMVFGPYTFRGDELGPGITLPKKASRDFAIAAGGSVGLRLPDPVGTIFVASGYVLYIAPTYIAVAGSIHLPVAGGLIEVDGGVNGEFQGNGGIFNIAGYISASIPAVDLSASAQAVISSNGLGVCGTISPFGFDVSVGAGIRWGHGPQLFIGSCDLGPFTAIVPSVTQAGAASRAGTAATTKYKVRLPAGLPSEMIKVTGTSGAPDITITGPGGVHASTNGGLKVVDKPFIISRVAQLDTTYVGIIRPPAGTYTITANVGSPAIAHVLHAAPIVPSVRARVSSHHGVMLLHYATKPRPGQSVIFAERSARLFHLIGKVKAATGTLAFRPSPGPAGPRQIVAEFVQGGMPVVLHPGKTGDASQVVVASYRAPGPPALARVKHLKARHIGTKLLIRFDGVRGTNGYGVSITLSSGQHEFLRVTTGALTVPGVFGEITGKVSVVALGNNTTASTGRAASVRFSRSHGD